MMHCDFGANFKGWNRVKKSSKTGQAQKTLISSLD